MIRQRYLPGGMQDYGVSFRPLNTTRCFPFTRLADCLSSNPHTIHQTYLRGCMRSSVGLTSLMVPFPHKILSSQTHRAFAQTRGRTTESYKRERAAVDLVDVNVCSPTPKRFTVLNQHPSNLCFDRFCEKNVQALMVRALYIEKFNLVSFLPCF